MAVNYSKNQSDPYLLATAFVDNELSEKEALLLEDFKKRDPGINKFIDSEKQIKHLLNKKLKRVAVPEDLKCRIQHRLLQEMLQKDTEAEPISGSLNFYKNGEAHTKEYYPPASRQNFGNIRKFFPYLVSTVSIILALGLGYLAYNATQNKTYSIENYAFKHFTEHNGIIENMTAVPNIDRAEQLISSNTQHATTVPKLLNATFSGVSLTEFVPGYETPVLIYNQSESGEQIYIFTFDLNTLATSKFIKRNAEAVRNCINRKDYHILDINGKHVVSWKWGDTWYTAISNHNGHELASLVTPLNNPK